MESRESPPEGFFQKTIFKIMIVLLFLSILFVANTPKELDRLIKVTWSEVSSFAPEPIEKAIKASMLHASKTIKPKGYNTMRSFDDSHAERNKQRENKIFNWMGLRDYVKDWGDNPWYKAYQITLLVIVRLGIVALAVLASVLFLIPAIAEGGLARARKIQGGMFFSGFFEAHSAKFLGLGFFFPLLYLFFPIYIPAWVVLLSMIGLLPFLLIVWITQMPEKL